MTTSIAERLKSQQFYLKLKTLDAFIMMAIDALSHLMYTKFTATHPTCTAVTRQLSAVEYLFLFHHLRRLHKLKQMHPKPQLLTIKVLSKDSVMYQYVAFVAQT